MSGREKDDSQRNVSDARRNYGPWLLLFGVSLLGFAYFSTIMSLFEASRTSKPVRVFGILANLVLMGTAIWKVIGVSSTRPAFPAGRVVRARPARFHWHHWVLLTLAAAVPIGYVSLILWLPQPRALYKRSENQTGTYLIFLPLMYLWILIRNPPNARYDDAGFHSIANRPSELFPYAFTRVANAVRVSDNCLWVRLPRGHGELPDEVSITGNSRDIDDLCGALERAGVAFVSDPNLEDPLDLMRFSFSF